MADIDELQIKIKADSAKASNSIESLVNSMNRLRESISFDTAKLSNIASGIRSISDAATGFKGGKSSEITSMVRALNKFSGVDANSIHGISSAVRDLASGIASVKAVDTSGLISMVSALSKIGGKASTQATKNLPALSAQLQNFVRQMNKIGALNFDMTNMSNLVTSISRLGSVASGRAVTNIPLLADNLKYLFETLSKAPNVSSNIIQMTQALGNLSNRSGSAISGLNTSISSLSGSFLGFKTSTGKALIGLKSFTRQILSSMGIYLGLYGAIRGIKNAIDISSALTEVQNVVDVTFGDMSKKVNDFAQDSIRQFGMSELTLKQTASRFQAMGTAMGIDSSLIKKANEFLNKQTDGYIGLSDSMADVSLNLTKLTADMASLYNIDQDVVSQDLAAIFTGQTRPLRDYGLDLTQATLKEWAMKQGLDSDIESMSQAEKTMLRYQYVLANTQTAQGDFARTADSWANQIRILKQSFEQLAAIIGGALINAFKPFVRTLNAVMQKVIAFATTVTNALGSIFGWKFEISAGGLADDWSDAAGSAADIADSTGQAAKNVEKMNKGLRAFDELNLITTPDSSSGSGSGGSGGGGASGGGASGGLVQVDTIFKDYESQIRSLRELGAYISDALSDAMESIDWDRIYSKARNFGKGLADFLNGLITPRLFGDVGMTIASALNTAIYAALSFGEEFDWHNFGESIASGINNFFSTFDFRSLAQTLNTWVDGIEESIKTALEEIDWETVISGIGDFLKELDFDTVVALTLLGSPKFLHNGVVLAGEAITKWVKGAFLSKIAGTQIEALAGLGAEMVLPITAMLTISVASVMFIDDIDELLVKKFSDLIGVDRNDAWEQISKYAYVGGGKIQDIDGNVTGEYETGLEDIQKWFNSLFREHGGGNVSFDSKHGGASMTFEIIPQTDASKWSEISNYISDWFEKRKETLIENIDEFRGHIESFKENVSRIFSDLENDISNWWNDISPWFTKERWQELGNNIKDGISTKWGEFTDWWTNTGFYEWWTNVSSYFTEENWQTFGENAKNALSTKWNEFSEWWSGTGFSDWWNNDVTPYFTKEKWTNISKGMKDGLTAKWNEFSSWWENTGFYKWWNQDVAPKFTTDKWTFSGISDGLKNAWNNAIAAVKHIWNGFANWMNSKLSFSWDAVNIAGKQIVGAGSINLGKIPTFAAGGFPSQYSMFMAGENGRAEMLGTVGGKTAVAGGQEITGIRDAVYSTSQQEIALLKQQNQLLSEILKKPMLSNNDVFNAAKSVYKGEAKRRYGDSAAFDPVWG